ncbi:hypothetical protein ACFL0D_01975 [Thermoproteota archaeon]
MVRCLECYYMHQPDRTKDQYFCLKARDYIEHDIDENIGCKGYKHLINTKYR